MNNIIDLRLSYLQAYKYIHARTDENRVKYFLDTSSLDNSEQIRFGKAMEAPAREKFLEVTNYECVQVGLAIKDKYWMIGSSADGIIRKDGRQGFGISKQNLS